MSFFGRAFERRNLPLSDERAWRPLLGGAPTKAGAKVDHQSALTYVYFWAAVNRLATSIGQLPLPVYKRKPNGDKEKAEKHELFRLLRYQPNPWMSAVRWKMVMQAHLATWGNCYSYIERGGLSDKVTALWPVRPDLVTVEAKDGERRYWFKKGQAGERELADKEILHIPGLGFDGIRGYSMVGLFREAIGSGLAVEDFGARFFGAGTHPGIVVTKPGGALSPEGHQNLRDDLTAKYSGLGNEHRILLLEEGMTVEKITIPPEDAQFLETRKFNRSQMATIFQIPAHLIGDLERATFCLPADSQVFAEVGPVRIADIKTGTKVWSRGDDGLMTLRRVLRCARTGSDRILRLRTTNRTIRANARHRILVYRSAERALRPGESGGRNKPDARKVRIEHRCEYVPAGELRKGDLLVSFNGTPDSNCELVPTRIASERFAEFCGLYLGGGCMGAGNVTIARAKSAEYMDHYRRSMVWLFTRCDGGNGRGDQAAVARAPVTLTEAERYTRFSSVAAVAELKELGLGGTAHTKRVPAWVFQLSDRLKLAFLRGFLDADGSVCKKGRIAFSSCNEALLSGIRHLCISLGIPVTNQYHKTGITRLPNGRTKRFSQYYFTCSDPGSNRRIGSHTPSYAERLNAGSPFNRKARRYPRDGAGFAEPFAELSRITSIESEAPEPVYDLEVEETHSFIADGVVVHNSNIEQQAIEYVVHCLGPWLALWEDEIRLKLFPPTSQMYFAEFNVDALLRGDFESRMRGFAIGRQWGFFSANDALRKLNMNSIGEQGDIYLTPLNMLNADVLLSPDAAERSAQEADSRISREAENVRRSMALLGSGGYWPAGAPTGDARALARFLARNGPKEARSPQGRQRQQRAFLPLFEDAGRRIVGREVHELKRRIPKALNKRDAADVRDLLDSYYAADGTFVKAARDAFLPTTSSYGAAIWEMALDEVGADAPDDDPVPGFASGYADTYAASHAASSRDQLLSLIDDEAESEDIETALLTRLDEWQQARPAKIGMEQSVNAGGFFARAAWSSAGVQFLRWSASGENCPLCSEMDGRTVGISQPFLEAGESVPGGEGQSDLKAQVPVRFPPLHNGCDCVIVPG